MNKTERRLYNERYRKNHREEHLLSCAKWYKDHKKEAVAYRKDHREESAAYRESRKEEISVYNANYRKGHLPEHTAAQNARHALILGATIGNLVEIKEIYRRAKEDSKVRCYLCGRLVPIGHRHVDHITPLSKGGMHRPSNLAVACDSCNQRKHDKLPEKVGILI